MLELTPYGSGKIISSQQTKALSDETPMLLAQRDSITERVNFTKKFKVILGSEAECSSSMLDLLLRDSTIKWCTDGS